MNLLPRLFALIALAAGANCTSAATGDATPATLEARLRGARAGDTIRLAPGDYPALAVSGHNWSPAVVVDATAARLVSVRLDDVGGLTWRGGTFDGGGTARFAFAAIKSRNLAIEGATMRNYLRTGISFSDVAGARIAGNAFSDMGSDGMSLAMSRRLVIDGNSCRDFKMTDKAHPDCIQLWSRPAAAPTADVTITNNVIDGNMQGIFMGDGTHGGVPDGGFDRVTIASNRVSGTFGNGIGVINCRDCVVRDNVIETRADFKNKVRVVIRGEGAVIACNNVARGTPASQGQEPCRK